MFDRAFVISLAIRPDRRDDFLKRMPKVSWIPEIEVWPAIHGDTCQPPANWTAGNGAWGCMRSHLAILEYCLNNRVGSYIVFEDDAQFSDEFDSKGREFLEALPDDWEQAYLGGQLMHARTHPPVEINRRVFRPYNVNRTHCFALSRNGMLPIYKHCSDLPYEKNYHIDHHLGRWHEDARNKVYCPRQWIVGQHGTRSNVSGKLEEITFFEHPATFAKDHWLYRTPACVIYRGSRSLVDVLPMLHFGNQVSNRGFDVTLEEAARLRVPHRAIAGWYSWVRTECVQDSFARIPALMHPELSEEDIRAALPDCKFILIESASKGADILKALADEGIQL